MQASRSIELDDSARNSFRSDDEYATEVDIGLPHLLSANQLLDSVCSFMP